MQNFCVTLQPRGDSVTLRNGGRGQVRCVTHTTFGHFTPTHSTIHFSGVYIRSTLPPLGTTHTLHKHHNSKTHHVVIFDLPSLLDEQGVYSMKFFINSFCTVECNDSGKRGYFKNTTSYSLPVTARQVDRTCLWTNIYTGRACRSSRVQRDAQDCRLKSIDIPQRCLCVWKIFD